MATVFTGDNNIRGVTSEDGTGFWASGSGGGTSGGIWWQTFGSTSGAVQVLSNPTNTRWPHVINGQLYVSTVVGATGAPRSPRSRSAPACPRPPARP